MRRRWRKRPLPASLLADATRAARLRFWIVTIGVLVIAAFAGSSAYDAWRSYDHDISTNHRELGNMAKALAEQAEGSAAARRSPAARYGHMVREPNALHPGVPPDDKLAARAAGLPQVREVRIIDEHGIPRFRSRQLPGG